MKTVVVLGASDKPERMSYTAVVLLKENGYRVTPVHPSLKELEGFPVVESLSLVNPKPDALSVYINPERSWELEAEIIAMRPGVVIFNPGSESDILEKKLIEVGIKTVRTCTVVALKTGTFEQIIS